MYVHKPLSFTIGKGKRELDPRLYDFMSFLGLLEQDAKGTDWNLGRKIGDKVERLYLYGKIKSDSDDQEAIKREIYNLQKALGVNLVGKSLVDKLWQHTMLDTSFNKKLENLSQPKEEEVVQEKQENLKTKVGEQKPIKEIEREKPIKEEPLKLKMRPGGEPKSIRIKI